MQLGIYLFHIVSTVNNIAHYMHSINYTNYEMFFFKLIAVNFSTFNNLLIILKF